MNKNPASRIQPATQALDPRTLGRPVHLLHNFVFPLREDLAEVFRTSLNRRYRASFELGEVTISRLEAVPQRCRWLAYTSELGRIGVAMERQVLLCVLDYRYGGREMPLPATETHAGTEAAQAAPRETATEERLAAMLGRQFVAALAERIEWLPESGNAVACTHEFSESAGNPPRPGIWAIRAEVSEPTRGVEGALWFTLDDAWMQRLLSRIAPNREGAKNKMVGAKPFATRLQLTLMARLLEKEMPLGQLLDTRVGDVIPVSLGNTDVLVDESRLFTARVAEYKGKLCLTAFEDVE
jgi:flagellar motor switch protein FliM